jgi:hypothetical protein
MRFPRFVTAALALTLAVGALGAPLAVGGSHAKAVAQPTIVRVDDRSGFDWADAGIGAAAGFALSVLCLGLVLLVAARSRPPT